MDTLPSSPSKFNARHHKTSVKPSPMASEDAQRLLKRLAEIVSAQAMAQQDGGDNDDVMSEIAE